jgi:hypothetical protein
MLVQRGGWCDGICFSHLWIGDIAVSERERMLEKIHNLCRVKIGRKKGLLMRSYEGMEVGIRTYNFDVISKAGFRSGYWTDSEPKFAERTIVSRIVENEECQEWDTLDDQTLSECLRFLQNYRSR